MTDLITPAPLRALDANGNPLEGAGLKFFLSGSTTIVQMYRDPLGTIPHELEIISEAGGVWPPVYDISGAALKAVAVTPLGATLPGFPIDPVLRTSLSVTGAASIPFTPITGISETDTQAAIESVYASAVSLSANALATGVLASQWKYGTYQGAAASTEFLFDIPTEATGILVLFNGLSLSGTDDILVQIGPVAPGAVETTGYSARSSSISTGVGTVGSTAGFIIWANNAAVFTSGRMELNRFHATSTTWIATHDTQNASFTTTGAGLKLAGAAVGRVRITRTGSNTFDAGQVNVAWR